MQPISPSQLQHLTDALTVILPLTEPADVTLHYFFRRHPKLGARDRAFIAETVYAVLRRRRLLETLCAPHSRPRLLALAWLVKFQGLSIRELTPLLKPREAEWLEQAKATSLEALPAAVRLDLPDWLHARLEAQHEADELVALVRKLNTSAPLDLRVNTLATSREAVLRQLTAEGIAAQATPYSPFGIRLAEKIALNRHPLFTGGQVEVQDEGSQLISLLLEPRRNEKIVDFCAGAGGKTLAIGAQMASQGRLYALDVSEKRLQNLKPRLKRSGLTNVQPILINDENDSRLARLDGKIDRVLVDAPCSGLGTLRRNPDLKWRQTPQDLEELTQKQLAILSRAARLLRPGGRLVYATCSLLAEENAAIVDQFLAQAADFQRLDAAAILAHARVPLDTGPTLQLYPHRHETDAFFAAVLEKTRPA